MIVGKAVKMANSLNVPVLGLVENMAYFECPNCNERHYIFGESSVEALAKEYQIGATAQIPINPSIASLCDAGQVDQVESSWLCAIAEAIA
jgi:Mrp family chromosome partitioning ATPase